MQQAPIRRERGSIFPCFSSNFANGHEDGVAHRHSDHAEQRRQKEGPQPIGAGVVQKYADAEIAQLIQDHRCGQAQQKGGHTPHFLTAAFAMHDTYIRKGDMRLVDWSEYIK